MQTAQAKAYGDWLVNYEWTHWVTLTISPKGGTRLGRAGRCRRSTADVLRAFKEEFHRFCTKVTGSRVPYVISVESGLFGDNPHGHALLYGTEAIPCARLAEGWRHGRATVEVYDPTRGAAFYLPKESDHSDFTWDMSKTLPPLRLHGEPR